MSSSRPASRLARAFLPIRIRAPMLNLPPELLDVIFSCLEKGDLWTVIHVSQLLRQVGLLPFLSIYGVSRSCVVSGAVLIPQGAHFLIPMIHRVQPICRLTILGGPRLCSPDLLSTVPIIPDVTIRFSRFMMAAQTVRPGIIQTEIPGILVTLSRNGMDPVVIVGNDAVRVSHRRRTFAVEWFPMPYLRPPTFSSLSNVPGCIAVFLLVVLVFVFNGFINFCLSIAWLYRYTLQPWDPATRITADLGVIPQYGCTIRIQTITVPGAVQFTLATFPPHHQLTLDRLPNLSSAQYVALLASLDLKDDLHVLTVRPRWRHFPAVVDFIRRHPLLHTLTVFSESFDPASLAANHMPYTIHGNITTLTAPAAYIPYILPADRSITDMTIFPPGDLLTLSIALDAIAALPLRDSRTVSHRLKLQLSARRCKSLPWVSATAREAEAGVKAVRGITHLELEVQFRGRCVDVAGFPGWLARRFPDLLKLGIRGLAISIPEQVALAHAVLDSRIGNTMSALTMEGVQFHA
ncbi:hypothetical protein C8R47DRAFT_1168403 [Mycena vitilis]|nr:hypothetical protein C8R47DRAFT_1168403 [Mycena vitilis]